MAVLSEKTRLSFPLVAVLVTLASAAAVAQFRISDTAAAVERLEADGADRERRISRSEDALPEIREVLKEIKQDVKEIRREVNRPRPLSPVR